MLSVKVSGNKRLARQIQALGNSKQDRRRLMRDAGRMVMRETKARLKGQRGLDGTPWAQRKRPHKRKRMMMRMGRSMTLRGLNEKGVTVTWKQAGVAITARKQQEGFKQQYKAAGEGEKRRQPDYSAPATAAQAKALIKAGYRRSMGKYKGGKKKGSARVQRVSQKWITENMSMGQAGFILRTLRGGIGEKAGKSTWEAEIPPRPFLGITKESADEMIKRLANETIERTRTVR